MSAKVKLISIISAFVLVLGIMIIGVLSAEQVQVDIGGSVSFNATNVYARVTGSVTNSQSNPTLSELLFTAEDENSPSSSALSTWSDMALDFDETPTPIEISITVENLSTQRTLTVNLTNTLSASGLDIAVERNNSGYTLGTNIELPISAGSGSSTTTFTLTLTVANPDEDLTDATFGYTLNMFDESTKKQITAQSADSTMGSVTGGGRFMIGEQVTLTATPGTDYLFSEWRANSIDGEIVSTSSTYTFTLGATSPTSYYAIFEEIPGYSVTLEGVDFYMIGEDTEPVYIDSTETVIRVPEGAKLCLIRDLNYRNNSTIAQEGLNQIDWDITNEFVYITNASGIMVNGDYGLFKDNKILFHTSNFSAYGDMSTYNFIYAIIEIENSCTLSIRGY